MHGRPRSFVARESSASRLNLAYAKTLSGMVVSSQMGIKFLGVIGCGRCLKREEIEGHGEEWARVLRPLLRHVGRDPTAST